MPLVSMVLLAKLFDHALLLPVRQPSIGNHDGWEQGHREDGRPVHHPFAKQTEKQAGILRVPNKPIEPVSCEPMLLVGALKLAPSFGEETYAHKCQDVSDDHRDCHAEFAHAKQGRPQVRVEIAAVQAE